MANFKMHFAVASTIGGAVSTGFFSLGILNSTTAVTALCLSIIGGVLPDIDHDNSTPLDIGFNILSIFVAFVVMFDKARHFSVAEMLVLWFGVYILVRYVFIKLFQLITTHRGIFHSVPAGALFGLLTTNTYYYFFEVAALKAWLYGFFLFLGYIVHLLLDEFVSMNLFGIKVKKSLGSAFKFYSKNLYASVGVYLAVVISFYAAPSSKVFYELILSIKLYTSFFSILLPQNEWFQGLL